MNLLKKHAFALVALPCALLFASPASAALPTCGPGGVGAGTRSLQNPGRSLVVYETYDFDCRGSSSSCVATLSASTTRTRSETFNASFTGTVAPYFSATFGVSVQSSVTITAGYQLQRNVPGGSLYHGKIGVWVDSADEYYCQFTGNRGGGGYYWWRGEGRHSTPDSKYIYIGP